MILQPTSETSHHHKVTNITMSPTSLSPDFRRRKQIILTVKNIEIHFMVFYVYLHNIIIYNIIYTVSGRLILKQEWYGILLICKQFFKRY